MGQRDQRERSSCNLVSGVAAAGLVAVGIGRVVVTADMSVVTVI